MGDTIYCDICDEFVDFNTIMKEETYNIKDKDSVTIKSKIAVCNNCGNELFNEEYEKENQKKAYDIFRENNNLLYSDEIYEIRKKYNLTQREISDLLGWGEITYHRYENGSLPDQAHNKQLLLLKNPRNVKNIIENSKHNLSEEKIVELKEKIKELIIENKKMKEITISIPNEIYDEINLEANKANISIENYTRILMIQNHYKNIIQKTKKRTKYETENQLLREYIKHHEINDWGKENKHFNKINPSLKAVSNIKGVH
jgi:putative zinc finger/helix-turn-helix YgiT family protein